MGRRAACIVGLTVSGLVACGRPTPRLVGHTDDGAAVYGVSCKKHASECVAAANKSCGHAGYDVVESDSHSGGLIADETPGPEKWYWLAFKCGGASSVPDFPWRGAKPSWSPGVTDPSEPVGDAGAP